MLLYPDADAARRENGFYCPANLPRPGEKVDVLDDQTSARRTATVVSSVPASQSSLYSGANARVLQPVPGFETDCSVTVQYADGTLGTVSAAQRPESLADTFGSLAAVGVCQALIFGLDSLDGDGDAWRRAQERHEELQDELKLAQKGKEPTAGAPPASGEFWGSSDESDEGDQAVRSTIRFHSDGRLTGRGMDGSDGAYRITKGRWGVLDGESKPTLSWVEVYDEGFEAAIEARYEASTGKIHGRFTSSRGVRGSFDLAPKPSIF